MKSSVVCVGSALIDELYFCSENVIQGTSNPATMVRTVGGVISNIAQHLALLEIPVDYLTILGNDADASWIQNQLENKGISLKDSLTVEDNTGKYTSFLNPDGSLHAAACVDICGKYLLPEYLQSKSELLKQASLIITDTNIELPALNWLNQFAQEHNKILLIEPVSVAKARKLTEMDVEGVYMITPNDDELQSICGNNYNDEFLKIESLLDRGIKNIWLRKGAAGSIFYNKNEFLNIEVPTIEITDSTGAGDAALAGWVAAHLNQFPIEYCIKSGHALALEVLQLHGAVVQQINKKNLKESLHKYYPDAQ
jgi:pseudouridine kinase